ncbi:MAG: four helix bundle protein [Thermoanaerobaculia bacterium]|nr:four helix bundle protein [Thermoanaerobaculia bacterium]
MLSGGELADRVSRFEDLIAWQKARELCRLVYAISRKKEFARDFALSDQMRRASISVGSNIAEGFERGNPKEFHQFLSIAKSSCAELRSQLYTAFDVGYISEDEFARIYELAAETGRVVGGLRLAVERQKQRKSAP